MSELPIRTYEAILSQFRANPSGFTYPLHGTLSSSVNRIQALWNASVNPISPTKENQVNESDLIAQHHEATRLDPMEQDLDCSDVRIYKVVGSIAVDVKVDGLRRAFAVREFDGHFLAGDTPGLLAFFAEQAEAVESELNPGSESFAALVRDAVKCKCPKCSGSSISSLLSSILGKAWEESQAEQGSEGKKTEELPTIEFVRTYFAVKSIKQVGRVHGCTDACGKLLGHIVTCCEEQPETTPTTNETASPDANADTVSDQV